MLGLPLPLKQNENNIFSRLSQHPCGHVQSGSLLELFACGKCKKKKRPTKKSVGTIL